MTVLAQLARVYDPNAKVTVCDILLTPRTGLDRGTGTSPVRTLTGMIRPDLSTADLLLLAEAPESGKGGTLRVWDLATGQLVREVSPGGGFCHAYVSKDGSGRVLCISEQGVCRLVHLETGNLLYRFAPRGVDWHFGRVGSFSACVMDGRSFLVWGDDHWELRDAADVTSGQTKHLKGALKFC
jgi:WD40 repeat protein